MKIKALIFDLDDTLVDSESAYLRSLKAVGIDPRGKNYLGARKAVKDLLPSKNPSARNRLMYFKQMMGTKFSAKKLLTLTAHYENALQKDIARQWKELERDGLLERLAQKYSLYVLTNENTRTQMLKMGAIDPNGKYFKDILTSEEVGFEKPSLKGFQALLKRNKLNPKSCVCIGDNEKNDLQSASKLKILTVHTYEFTGKPSRKHPSLAKLSQLEKLLKALK